MVRQDLYKLLQECTVRLSSSSGIGTGFFIAPGGWILTCEHVVEQSERVEVLWLSGERQQELTAAVKLRVPIPVDLALLQLEGKAPDHKCVYLDRDLPQIGDTLYTFGYPQGYGTENYSGGDSATTKYEGKSFQDDVLVLKLKEGQIQEGYSGSPLLNVRTGKVCGIVSISRDTSSDLGGRATPIPLLFQPKEITASQDEQQLILSTLKGNQKFHQIDKEWSNIISPPLWTQKSVIVPSLSVVFLLTISLFIWRSLDPLEMPTGSYDVAVINFATFNQKGKLERSEWSKVLSRWVKNMLEKEKNQAENIDTENWNISKANKYDLPTNSIKVSGKKLEFIGKEFESFTENINADLLIYGCLTETENPDHNNSDNKLLTLGFYVSPHKKKFLHAGLIDAFDLKGTYQVGEPKVIDLSKKLDVEKILSTRVKPLFWLIAGLNSIQITGDPTAALRIFQQAEKILNPVNKNSPKKDEKGKEDSYNWEGKEVFYFCMGQVALFAANSSNINLDVAEQYANQAEYAFNEAVKSNNKYLRPKIGLGGVYLTRAEWYYDQIDKLPKNTNPNTRSQLQKKRDTALNAAIASYEEAVKQLPQSQPDTWSEYAAPLGLGTAWITKGYTDLNLNQDKKAEELQKKAVGKIQETIDDLEKSDEYRLLAQAYSNLGSAYGLGADIRFSQGDKKSWLEMRYKASEALLRCQSQGTKVPNDLTLNQQIVKNCDEKNKNLLKDVWKLSQTPPNPNSGGTRIESPQHWGI